MTTTLTTLLGSAKNGGTQSEAEDTSQGSTTGTQPPRACACQWTHLNIFLFIASHIFIMIPKSVTFCQPQSRTVCENMFHSCISVWKYCSVFASTLCTIWSTLPTVKTARKKKGGCASMHFETFHFIKELSYGEWQLRIHSKRTVTSICMENLNNL